MRNTSSLARPMFRPEQWLRIYVALLAAAGMLAFGNGTSGVLVLDDLTCLSENETLSQWNPDAAVMPSGLHHRWAGRLTFTANYWFGGHRPDGSLKVEVFHITNILLHVGAAMFLFGLTRRTLQLPQAGGWTAEQSDFLAFAAALLWLVHPLQTAAVTYVIQRLEVIMGLAFLGALYCLTRGAREIRSWPWLAASIAWCWIGAGAKESIAMLLPVALLYDRAFLAASWRELVAKRWAVYLGYAGAIVWLLAMLGPNLTPTDDFGAGFGNSRVSVWEYLRTQPMVLLHYLKLVVWPAELCFDYGWPIENDPQRIFLPGACILAIVATSGVLWFRAPAWGFLGLAYFLMLAPTSSVLPIFDAAFEHRMYLPLAPLAIGIVVASAVALSRGKRFLPANYQQVGIGLLVVASLACILRSRARNSDYDSALTLWEKCRSYQAARGGVWPRVIFHLARARHELGDRDESMELLQDAFDAMEQNPAGEFVPLIHALGVAHYSRREYEQATKRFQRAVDADPKVALYRINLARSLGKLKRFDDAENQFRQIEANDKSSAPMWQAWGEVMFEKKEYALAAKRCRQALELKESLIPARLVLAKAQLELGDYQATLATLGNLPPHAKQALEAALILSELRSTAGNPAFRNGAEANNLAQQAVSITKGKSAAAWAAQAAALAENGKYTEAAEAQTKALALLPENSSDKDSYDTRLRLYRNQQPFRRIGAMMNSNES